jgi:hypothetical protein
VVIAEVLEIVVVEVLVSVSVMGDFEKKAVPNPTTSITTARTTMIWFLNWPWWRSRCVLRFFLILCSHSSIL